ncbi:MULTISPECIES: hypothetical protein [unclassified Candidatus Frackibacter]|uniref:hypothetical protein n=1 Tax=unclassified Candidatus Frackibacter TaxID=2648818 RepID=UPI000889927F|nr:MULTISPECIES: hypothetical protein [unclassified Candidatus Frackibacter]SDC26341.1 hypothetical protein SAMN04515661_10525 [Candidatus Frackibacter sp. WG11]SEM53375.1 hypothetical protein SAMN04488698_10626 [Candidatus Frackibacter sp. WG12]SFL55158.1 hypothetical protein SAMN04488699_10569 [Candidatus Frackibacter sp. WG13]
MNNTITLQLPTEVDNFISNLAFSGDVSREEIIIKILTEYYHHLEQSSDEIPEELSMLKDEEGLLTISDTFKKEFNES